MNLLRLIDTNASLKRWHVIVAALLSGLASTGLLALVNVAAREISENGYDTVDWLLAALFVVAMALYFVSETWLLNHVAAATESALDAVRRRLFGLLAAADFEKLERYGRGDVGSVVAGDVAAISQITQYLSIGFRSLVLVVVLTLYLAWLSTTAVITVAVVLVIAATYYLRRARTLNAKFREMQEIEQAFGERIRDLIDGFKEIRMWSARSRDVGKAFDADSRHVRRQRGRTQTFGFDQYVLGQVAVFVLLASVVFLVPSYVESFRQDVVQVTTTVLFLIGPVGALVQTMTIIAEAEASAGRLERLENDLEAMREEDTERPREPFAPDFSEIRGEGLCFAYQADIDDRPFTVGPVDVTFPRGQITFITGGNGSGKTTLIRMLCGLYRPNAGRLWLDGHRIAGNTLQPYRELISSVSSDYHLFRRLYGLEAVDPTRIRDLLEWMQLDHVTRVRDGAFERIALSAGQRKRLALVVAMLEDRPIMVLDEWAADQDPVFRRRFYREILPALKAQGKTVIAVTHDDHYFDAADRRLHMEEGRVVEDRLNGAGEAGA